MDINNIDSENIDNQNKKEIIEISNTNIFKNPIIDNKNKNDNNNENINSNKEIDNILNL